MSYIIIEIQKSNNGSVAVVQPIPVYSDRAAAEEKYHTALAAAAVSNIDVHSVVMMSDTGDRIKGESYYHANSEA